MPEAFAVPLPPLYFDAMAWFDWLNFDWFGVGVPSTCIGDFGTRLMLKALTPLALLAVVIGVACASARSMASVLPSALLATFALVPSVSARIFSTFSCEAFGFDDRTNATRSFLFADYAIECAGSEYDTLARHARILVVLWPIAVPAAFLGLLLASRSSTADLSRATRFLHAEYVPEHHYWEVWPIFLNSVLVDSRARFPTSPCASVRRLVAAGARADAQAAPDGLRLPHPAAAHAAAARVRAARHRWPSRTARNLHAVPAARHHLLRLWHRADALVHAQRGLTPQGVRRAA